MYGCWDVLDPRTGGFYPIGKFLDETKPGRHQDSYRTAYQAAIYYTVLDMPGGNSTLVIHCFDSQGKTLGKRIAAADILFDDNGLIIGQPPAAAAAAPTAADAAFASFEHRISELEARADIMEGDMEEHAEFHNGHATYLDFLDKRRMVHYARINKLSEYCRGVAP